MSAEAAPVAIENRTSKQLADVVAKAADCLVVSA